MRDLSRWCLYLVVTIQIGLSGFNPVQAQLSQDEYELAAYIVMPEMLLYRIVDGADDYLLIDVRPHDEFKSGHITGAVNLPLADGTFDERKDELPRNKTIVLVSEDGEEALKALRILLQGDQGDTRKAFEEVLSIEGGMNNWPYKAYIVTE
jgi:rhodanese-related sulfurtransferase